MKKVKVLVAGYQNSSNPIMNNVKKYDCEAVWTGADKSKFDKDADIVIIVQSCINKEQAKAVKEHYYGGAEILYPWKGFSEIANAFHQALLKAKDAKRPAITCEPGQHGLTDVVRLVAKDPLPVQKIKKPYSVEQVVPVVHQCLKNGFSHQDIADYLNADGWMPHGRMGVGDFTPSMVKNLIDNHSLHIATADKQEKEKDQLNLIDEILKSHASAEQKLDWVAKANRGEIKSLEWTERKIVNGELHFTQNKIGEPPVFLKLTKKMARMILLNITDLNDFAKGGS